MPNSYYYFESFIIKILPTLLPWLTFQRRKKNKSIYCPHFFLTRGSYVVLFFSERDLETCDLDFHYKSPPLGRHLSKSASELSSPREPPEIRPYSAAPPGSVHLSVVQKTHSFFTQLRVSRGFMAWRGVNELLNGEVDL